MARALFCDPWCLLQTCAPSAVPGCDFESLLFELEYHPPWLDRVSQPSPMLTEPCAAMSMGTDVRDLTLLPPAPPVSSIPGAGSGCGMSVGGGQWTQLLDLHPSSPYSSLSSHHSLIKQEPSWGSGDPVDDPHCGLGAFTLHFSGQFTGSGPCRVGAFGEPPAGQPRMFSNGTCLPSCMDNPPPPRNQGTLSHPPTVSHLCLRSWVKIQL